jgi:DNA-binding CsgD family transcriptional regulator/tetratricopeptide (TPR) repeat protein
MAVAEILGREAEVQAVGRFLDGPAPAALILEGPAGIGKTTVWRSGLDHASRHRVLMTRPSEVETAPASAGLIDLLGDVFDELGSSLPAPQRAALGVALLREDGAHADAQPGTVSAGALGLLCRAAEESPVLLAVDDLQWLDPATSGALAFALRRLGETPVLLLATTRTEEGGPAHDPVPFAGDRMTIPPLDVQSLSRLIARELGRRLAWPIVRRIATIASGNAFLAIELARVASTSGAAPDELSPEALSRSMHIKRLAETRVRVLPESTRTALGVVAALGEPRATVLSRALSDEAALDAAFDAGIVEEQGDRVRFTHPLLVAGALSSLSPRRRRSIHRALADLADTAEQRARHLAAATTEPSAEVAAAIEDGAAAALARGAPAAAARLLEDAVRLTPAADGVALGRRLVSAGNCREQAGDPIRALELFRRAVRASPPGPQRAQARIWAASHEHTAAKDNVIELRVALGECATDVTTRATCLQCLGLALLIAGDGRSAQQHLRQAVDLSAHVEDEELRVFALSLAGFVDELLGPGSGRRALETAARLADHRLMSEPALSPDALLGTVRYWADELEPARALLLGVRERSVAAGDEQGAALVNCWLTELEARACNLSQASTYADEAIAILDLGRDDLNLGCALVVRALTAAYEGDEHLARRMVARGLTICDALGDHFFAAQGRSVLGFLELSLDRPAEALGHLRTADDELRAMGVEEPGAFPHRGDLAEALIATGRIEEAQERLTQLRALGERIDRPRPLCTALRGQAMLAAHGGDLERAVTLFEQAIELHDRFPAPLERGRTLLALGMTHRRARHRRVARERLREAETLFDDVGAAIWRDRARRELGRISGRAAGGRDELTPTERQIAERVATGRSNREVAAELFVTARTVEANLTRIYAKVGVRSRGELAARRGEW